MTCSHDCSEVAMFSMLLFVGIVICCCGIRKKNPHRTITYLSGTEPSTNPPAYVEVELKSELPTYSENI